jgi:hypothetical protein
VHIGLITVLSFRGLGMCPAWIMGHYCNAEVVPRSGGLSSQNPNCDDIENAQ